MSEPFISEIRMFSFGFVPRGWAECNGQLLPINQNQALFSLLGTTYGGNGSVNFALPNLNGRVPIHVDSGYVLGQSGGSQTHQLSLAQLPQHSHPIKVSSTPATQSAPTAGVALAATATPLYRSGASTDLTPLGPGAVASIGGAQAHTNMQPFLVITFAVALQGIFPSPT